MSALPRLTPAEAEQAKQDCFNKERQNFMTVLEALGEMNNSTGTQWMRAFIERDWFRMGELQDQAVYEYLGECGTLDQAVHERQGQIERADFSEGYENS